MISQTTSQRIWFRVVGRVIEVDGIEPRLGAPGNSTMVLMIRLMLTVIGTAPSVRMKRRSGAMPGSGSSRSSPLRIVCECAGVTEEEVQDAIDNGATNQYDVGLATGACRDCGSCAPDIVRMIHGY